MPTFPRRFAGVLLFLSLAALLACGAPPSEDPPFLPPGAGIVFSFPGDGQLDVPVAATVTLSFSHAIDVGTLADNCAASSVSGLCLEDSEGRAVIGIWNVVGDGGRSVEFVPETDLAPGKEHRVHVASAILPEGVGNLPSAAPIVSFTTRLERSAAGVPASVIAINGDRSATYAPGAGLEPGFPLIDFATFRLVFSEPMDERTAILGSSLVFVELPAGGGAEIPVPGNLLGQGIHFSFDPDEDLIAGRIYEMRIAASFLDLGGEAATPQSFRFSPGASHLSGELLTQVLDVAPGIGDENFPQDSTVSALARNNVFLSSDLVGDNLIQLNNGFLEAEMAHPKEFRYSVPIVIRKGQSLEASGLEVALGGVVTAGLSTGTLTLSFVSDVTGIMVRNRFWPETVIPDNREAPLHVALSFDLAVSAADAIGNAVLTQTIYGVQATGIAEVVDGQLLISNLASIELDLLGVARAPAKVALAFATTLGESVALDTTPPTLRSTYPESGNDILESGDSLLATFSESVQVRDADAVELRTESGTRLDADVRTAGSMVVITPAQPLPDEVGFRVFLGGGITDLNGNSWDPQSTDPTAGEGFFAFKTVRLATESPLPPVLMTVYPGAPCALVGEATASRHCVGGTGQDTDYLSFELPSDHSIEAVFDQPMDRGSVVLGTSCGTGSFRIEAVSGTSCQAAIPGRISVSERGVRFFPESDWDVGGSYRVTLRGGANGSCDADEMCGLNALPLNTTPLASTQDAGGPDVELYFVGAPASKGEVAVTAAYPIVDRNGNGKVDAGETKADVNRAAVSVASFSGLVSDATIDMEDCDTGTVINEGCMYMSSDLVVVLDEKLSDCVINTPSGTVNASDCIPVTVTPGAIYGTELNMDASVLGLGLIQDLKTGKVVLRVRQSSGPVRGYIIEGSNGAPEMMVTLSAYMDAPDLLLLGGLSEHDLVSKELTVSLRGSVDFRSDGRLSIALENESLINIEVGISALGVGAGSMTLEIAAGAMQLNLMSRAARGGLR